ncbi:hypothetical protein H5410_046398 [Solanum commersonii]|uniref:Uncharacterized protein n=1 Tax=Solanum commersonii TaxID=4109 RepID=A0A9J5XFE6_SOLCO|nr:hypothetical protein H5410_046398 [Solanum commersonii]
MKSLSRECPGELMKCWHAGMAQVKDRDRRGDEVYIFCFYFRCKEAFVKDVESLPEVDLQHSAIWIASVYLMLLMHFLENKVAVDLTRSEFVEAQEAMEENKIYLMLVSSLLTLPNGMMKVLFGMSGWREVEE